MYWLIYLETFSGSAENNERQSLQTRTRLRKTRLELLGREYEVCD